MLKTPHLKFWIIAILFYTFYLFYIFGSMEPEDDNEFSGYTREAKLALFGIFAYNAVKKIFIVAQANNLEDSIAIHYPYMHWAYLLLTVIMGALLAWISDNYTPRHHMVELNGYVQLISIAFIPIYMTKEIPKVLRHFFFYMAWFTSSFYLASSGIIHSVFFDQVNMNQLPDHKGYMRKYILYNYMCRTASHLIVYTMYANSLSYDIKHYIVSFYSFVLLLSFQLIFFSSLINIYPSIVRENLLKDCLYTLVKPNKNKTENRKGPIEYSANKLVQVCWPLVWVMFGILCSDLAGAALIEEVDELGQETYYIPYVKLISMMILFPLNELVIIPFLMKHTFLKSTVHLFGVGFLWLSISLLIGGVFDLQIESTTTTQPSQRWFGQLRFFSLVDQNIILTIDEISIKISPYDAGYFLRIPVDQDIERTVHVKIEGKIPYKQNLEVKELKSLSHYVDDKEIRMLPRPDPLNKFVKLDIKQSYFYALENPNEFILKFFSSDGNSLQLNYPNPDEILESIEPGVYNLTVVKGSDKEVGSFQFLPGNIYCLHSFLKNDSNIGVKFFYITDVQGVSPVMLILLTIASSYGKVFLLMSFYYFLQTESPVYLRGTTFTFGELIYRVTNLLWINKLVRIKVTAVGLFSMSLALFGLTCITWKYVMYFNFSHYRYK